MPNHRILYIIGFMGSGKTTAGRKLASMLKWSFVDLDKKIEEHTGLKIHEIFSQHGEDHFRRTETEVLRSLATDSDTVISTGGGTPCHNDNMKFMQETGLTIYLKMTPGQLVSRLGSSSDERPLLSGLSGDDMLNFVENKLAERAKWYDKSQLIIDGFNLDISLLDSIVKLHFRFTG